MKTNFSGGIESGRSLKPLSKRPLGHLLMEKNDFYIDIVPVLVKEVFEEVGDTFQSDVTAHHDMPAKSNTQNSATSRRSLSRVWDNFLSGKQMGFLLAEPVGMRIKPPW